MSLFVLNSRTKNKICTSTIDLNVMFLYSSSVSFLLTDLMLKYTAGQVTSAVRTWENSKRNLKLYLQNSQRRTGLKHCRDTTEEPQKRGLEWRVFINALFQQDFFSFGCLIIFNWRFADTHVSVPKVRTSIVALWTLLSRHRLDCPPCGAVVL